VVYRRDIQKENLIYPMLKACVKILIIKQVIIAIRKKSIKTIVNVFCLIKLIYFCIISVKGEIKSLIYS